MPVHSHMIVPFKTLQKKTCAQKTMQISFYYIVQYITVDIIHLLFINNNNNNNNLERWLKTCEKNKNSALFAILFCTSTKCTKCDFHL